MKECDHDWEYVEYSNLYKIYLSPGIAPIWVHLEKYPFDDEFGYKQLGKKVCLECGECVDEEKEYYDEVGAIKKKKEARENLAKKMWNDCNQKGE